MDLLEDKLRDEGLVNLGQAVRLFCRPPFGCNRASAGLLLGVFAAARRNEIQFLYRKESVPAEKWLGLVVQGNFFQLEVLDDTDIKLVQAEESDFWKSFLDNWEMEATYDGRVALYERALAVAKGLPVPPGLRDRYELRKRDAEAAAKHLGHYEKVMEEQRGYAARAYDKGDCGNLARCACSLQELLQQMREEGSVWTAEQIAAVENEFGVCKLGATRDFDTWLSSQVETDPLKYGHFQIRMTKTAENFEKLNLPVLAQRVREQLNKVARDLENLQRLKTIFDEVDTFLAATRIGPASKVLDIRNSLNRIAELEKKIQEAFQAGLSVLRLNETWDRLQELKKSGNLQLKTHRARAEAVWDTRLGSIDDVRQTAQEVRSLLTLYDGLEDDLADFRLMLRVLDLIEEHYRHMDTLNISASELEQRYEEAAADVRRLLGEDGEIPWSIDETLGKLKKEIEDKRKRKAEEWMAQHVPKAEQLLTLSAKAILEVRRRLNSAPPYLAPQQMEMVQLILAACSKRLEELAVEGLIAQFKELSPEAQREFLRRVLALSEERNLKSRMRG